MKQLCRELERHLESGAERLPGALQAHLTGCAKCQRVWRLHQAYQRALHAARREPTPACELPWSRIQAQLAARTVSRRPFGWLRPALAWGTAVAVVLAVGAALFPFGTQPLSQGESLAQVHQAELRVDTRTSADTAHDAALTGSRAEPSVMAKSIELCVPATRIIAQATPRMREITRPAPPAPETPQRGTQATQRRDTEILARRRLDEAVGMPALGSVTEQSFAVASLPLTPFRVGDQSASVEYLPISYGSPSSHHEVSNNEAVIGSF
jgi:hypothetical protein